MKLVALLLTLVVSVAVAMPGGDVPVVADKANGALDPLCHETIEDDAEPPVPPVVTPRRPGPPPWLVDADVETAIAWVHARGGLPMQSFKLGNRHSDEVREILGDYFVRPVGGRTLVFAARRKHRTWAAALAATQIGPIDEYYRELFEMKCIVHPSYYGDEIVLTKRIEEAERLAGRLEREAARIASASDDTDFLYAMPTLKSAEEQTMFLAMNLLKHRALRWAFQDWRSGAAPLHRESIRSHLDRARRLRGVIIAANTKLAKNTKRPRPRGIIREDDIDTAALDGMMRAVDGFDVGRGFKFSTYATWSMRRAIQALFTFHTRLRRAATVVDASSSDDEDQNGLLDALADEGALEPEAIALLGESKREALKALDGLEENPRTVLILRFGLGGEAPKTLNEIGERIGLTRERVRQIEAAALKKLRFQLN